MCSGAPTGSAPWSRSIAGQTIGPGLLAKILRQAKVLPDQFRELL
jgi:hypothetical protein